MDIWTTFAIIFLAAMIHASFNLSISVLTLFNGHALSKKKTVANLTKLSSAMVFGSIFSTILLFCTFAFITQNKLFSSNTNLLWAVNIGLLISTGISVWLFYYRKVSNQGTELWIPRNIANFLKNRAKKTNHSAEAFSLGVMTVLFEIIFIFPPILSAALATNWLSPDMQFISVVFYTTIANLPLFSIFCMISNGQSISEIQKWRENNKKFMQFISGLGSIILAFFIYGVIFCANFYGVKL